jgi:cephalosporin hydroxylase
MQIDELYSVARATPSDIWEHLELLARLSSLSDHVTEFGARHGTSTTALLFGRPQVVVSYDASPLPTLEVLAQAAREASVRFEFHQADVLNIEIEPTDFLFIDTLHTYDQLTAELAKHAGKVRRFVALHDTSTFGDRGELSGTVGLWPAVARFLRQSPEWALAFYMTNNNGLTVLERARGPRIHRRLKAHR